MLDRKAQAAMEFLTSYGWAILVAVIAIGALAYMGVLNPDRLFPRTCALPAGITCLDSRVESYRAIIVLQNNLGELITVTNVLISSGNQTCIDNETIDLYNSEKAVFTITQCNNGGEGGKVDGKINVTYTIENRLPHTISGTLRAKIESGASVSSQSVCQNAQNNSLCDGLDIVFGEGYRAACCGEYGLCCP